jgi:hypothetical protein
LQTIPSRPDADVVVIHQINDNRMNQYAAEFGEPTRFRHRWWFPEDYRDITLPQFLGNLANPASYGIWWDYFFNRKTVSPLGSTDAVIYFPPDFRPTVRP